MSQSASVVLSARCLSNGPLERPPFVVRPSHRRRCTGWISAQGERPRFDGSKGSQKLPDDSINGRSISSIASPAEKRLGPDPPALTASTTSRCRKPSVIQSSATYSSRDPHSPDPSG